MKRRAVIPLLCVLAGAVSGCYGPNQLARGLDAWGNQLYVDSPWVAQVANYTGVLLVGHLVATAIDYLILNPFDFWGIAVPTGHGTPYVYPVPLQPTQHLRRPPWQYP